jgi:hypothetical protein
LTRQSTSTVACNPRASSACEIRARHSALSAPAGASRCTLTFAPSAWTRSTPPASGPDPSSMRTDPRRLSPDHAIRRTSAGSSTSSEGAARCEASAGMISIGARAGATDGDVGKKPISTARRRSSGSSGSSTLKCSSLFDDAFVRAEVGVEGMAEVRGVGFASVVAARATGVRGENGTDGRAPRPSPGVLRPTAGCPFNGGIIRARRVVAWQSCAYSLRNRQRGPSRATLQRSGAGSDTK